MPCQNAHGNDGLIQIQIIMNENVTNKNADCLDNLHSIMNSKISGFHWRFVIILSLYNYHTTHEGNDHKTVKELCSPWSHDRILIYEL